MSQIERVTKFIGLLTCPYYCNNLLRHGVAASAEHDSFLRSQSFDVIVDVGANRGQFSLAARRWNPFARIIAFEPLDSPARVYREVFANDRAAVLFKTAISSETGPTTIHVSRRDDSSSLLPISCVQTSVFPGTEATGTAIIDAAPLDSFARQIGEPQSALLKIDVQGSELNVLQSAPSILPKFSMIYAELSFAPLYLNQPLADEVIAYLRDRSFALIGVYNVTYKAGVAVQADFLFRRGSVNPLEPAQ